MKRSLMWLIGGAIVMAFAIVMFVVNMRRSIEFTGGVSVTLDSEATEEQAYSVVDNVMSQYGDDYNIGVEKNDIGLSILIKSQLGDDADVAALTDILKQTLVQENIVESDSDIISLSIIGPSIGEYMKQSAKNALIVGIILMAIYMIFSFSAIRHVISPAMLAIVVVVTMLFDVSVPAGAYGVLMGLNQTVQIDTIFVIAILTTIGYSINDTIIIFDRIRENALKYKSSMHKKGMLLGEIIEMSLWQTMRRSIGTSLSTLLVVIAMYVLGSGVIKLFAFTIGFGILAGSFSSIFIAAPLTYVLMGTFFKEYKKLKDS